MNLMDLISGSLNASTLDKMGSSVEIGRASCRERG